MLAEEFARRDLSPEITFLTDELELLHHPKTCGHLNTLLLSTNSQMLKLQAVV